MLDSLHSLLTCLTIWLSAFGAGQPLTQWLRLGRNDRLATLTWSCGLGAAVIGWLFLLLDRFGWLQPTTVGLITIATAFWGLGVLFCAGWKTLNTRQSFQFGSLHNPPTQWRHDFNGAIFGLALISAITILVCALAPPLSPKILAGTLQSAKQLTLAEPYSITSITTSRLTLTQLWFGWGLVLDGPIAAGLIQWSFGLLLAAATVLLAREALTPSYATVAGALTLLAPGVQYQQASPLDELAMAAFFALALAALGRAWNRGNFARHCFVASMMLGTALPIMATADPADGRITDIAQIGIVLLALVATSLFSQARRQTGTLWLFLLIVIVSGLAFSPTSQWWICAVPLLAIIATHGWQEFVHFPYLPQRLSQAVLIALVVISLRWPLTWSADRILVALGGESREHYLLRHHPEFAAVIVANHIVPENGRLLTDDPLAAYLHCRTQDPGTWLAHREYATSKELLGRLRRDGITHLLLANPDGNPDQVTKRMGIPADVDLESLLPLAEFRLTKRDSSVWHYRLLQLR